MFRALSSPDHSGTLPWGRIAYGAVRVPPSKSYTHRYLTLALLAGTPITIERPLVAEDTLLFLSVLEQLGWTVVAGATDVRLLPGPLPPAATLHCGNAGTLFRLLVAALTTLPGQWTVDGVPRLRERPIGPLLAALRALGAEITCLHHEGHAPLLVRGGALHGGRVTVDAAESSQYLSALLLAGLAARGPLSLEVAALTSAPYVEITLETIARFGGRVTRPAPGRFELRPGLHAPAAVAVEGDYSAACYPAAAALLTGGSVLLGNLEPASPQGDRAFLALCAAMGGEVAEEPDGLRVTGRGALRAVDVDLSAMPDQVPTLAALAPFAHGTTEIRNVAHLRIKESDRLRAVASELGRVGATVTERPDGLSIPGVWAAAPPPAEPVRALTHGDHRIAMMLALVGLRRPGISLDQPAVVTKSYPQFWADMERLLTGEP